MKTMVKYIFSEYHVLQNNIYLLKFRATNAHLYLRQCRKLFSTRIFRQRFTMQFYILQISEDF